MANAVFAFIVAVGISIVLYAEKAWGWKADIPALPMFATFVIAVFARQAVRLYESRRK